MKRLEQIPNDFHETKIETLMYIGLVSIFVLSFFSWVAKEWHKSCKEYY